MYCAYSQCVRPTAFASDSADRGVAIRWTWPACRRQVRHQAVTVDGQTEPFGLLCEYFEIDAAVVVDKEDVLAVIAALCDVVRAIRHDDSRYAWHRARILPATSRPRKQK